MQLRKSVELVKSIHLSVLAVALLTIGAPATTLAGPVCEDIFAQESLIADRISEKEARAARVLEAQQGSTTLQHLSNRLKWMMSEIAKRSQFPVFAPKNLKVKVGTKRNDVLDAIYQNELLEASPFTMALADKLMAAKVLEQVLGPRFASYHPKTLGMVELLSHHGLVDPMTGKLLGTRDQVEQVLERLFPNGFIVKTTTGWSSKGRNFYVDKVELLNELFAADSDLYSAPDYSIAFLSPALGVRLSGERWMLQEKLGYSEALAHREGTGKGLREYRAHTFWGVVVRDGTKARWVNPKSEITPERLQQVNHFLQSFLDLLPLGLRQQQAWSFDIVEVTPGDFRIVEINTNRGMANHWSGSLHNPKMLGALVRHVEDVFGWEFRGFNGVLLRNDLGNFARYLRYIRDYTAHNRREDENLRNESGDE